MEVSGAKISIFYSSTGETNSAGSISVTFSSSTDLTDYCTKICTPSSFPILFASSDSGSSEKIKGYMHGWM